MTAGTIEPNSRRLALRATGLLGTFNRAGVLEAADVHVASRLGDLAQEPDERVVLAVALTVRAARAGAVCLDLDQVDATVTEIDTGLVAELPWPERASWRAAVEASALARIGVLRWDQGLLYLDRHWREERQVCDDLLRRLGRPLPWVDEDLLDAGAAQLFPASWAEQRTAALAAARQWTTVLTGGPGTGKTTTVARLLALVAEQHEALHGRPPRIALAAPTGKAATRLQESVAREAARLPDSIDRDRVTGLAAGTVHRLLGWRPDSSTRFRHRRDNPLPYDVVVVDEVSMVSLVQMARLLDALRDTTRLVLVGDPDQLASVEAGAVLADVVAGFGRPAPGGDPAGSPVVSLTTTYRTQAADGSAAVDLDLLAADLRAGDDDAAVARLTSGSSAVRLVDPSDEQGMATVLDRITAAAYSVTLGAEQFDEDAAGALVDLLDDHRLLCAHREGPFGVGGWNRQVQRLVEQRTGIQHFDDWYAGRPVLITANDSGLGLSNGDLGITVRLPDGRLRVLVRIGTQARLYAPTRLSGVETVYAMTVHKSQGSEARAVTVVLPPEDSRLLTRELFYTAVTRAREQVTIVGTEAELRAAMGRQVQRASGLAGRLRAATSAG